MCTFFSLLLLVFLRLEQDAHFTCMRGFPFCWVKTKKESKAPCTQVLSKSSDDFTPTHLWQLDSAHHGHSVNSHTLYAYLHDVTLAPGPFNTTTNASLQFGGTSSSYVDIPNNGELNATSAFSWVMLIRPTTVAAGGEKIILEYWDGTGGVRLKQNGRELTAEVTDTDDNVHTVSTSHDVLTAGQWKFITLTFIGFDKKKMEIYFADYNEKDVDESVTLGIPDGTVARGTSDVRLGVSVDPSLSPFSGNVGCLRYYDAMIDKFDPDYYTLSCDPESTMFQLDSLSEHTENNIKSTTGVVTPGDETTVPTTQPEDATVQTTEQEETTKQADATVQTTQQEETTQPEDATALTTEQEETTQPEDATLQTTEQEETTQPEESTVLTTQQTTGVKAETTQASFFGTTTYEISSANPTSGFFNSAMNPTIYAPRDTCVELSLEPGTGTTFSSTTAILVDVRLNSLSACVGMCISSSGCRAIAVEKTVRDSNSPGRCLVAGLGYQTAGDIQFYFYRLRV